MASRRIALGELISPVSEKNRDAVYTTVVGISIDKEYMPSVANLIGTDLSKYGVVRKGRFALNPMHVGRDKRVPIALYEGNAPALVSPAYQMFEAIDHQDVADKYLDLLFKTDNFDHACWFHTDGTVRGGLTWNDLCSIEITLPDISVQKDMVRMANVLESRLETVVISRNKIRSLMSVIAVEAIRSGKYSEESLTDNVTFTNGLAMQKFRPIRGERGLKVIKIRELNQGFCDEKSDVCTQDLKEKNIISAGDLVFSWSGSLTADVWGAETAGLNQHLFKVESNRYPEWFCMVWILHYLRQFQRTAKDKGTTFGHIKRDDLDRCMVLVPNDMANVDQKVGPLFDYYVELTEERIQLLKLRKVLLSKLA